MTPPSPVTSSPTSDTVAWHVVYTKPRQEDVALLNLERQGYVCYLPKLNVEKIRRGKTTVVTEPMFARYLFVQLQMDGQGKSWSPIRSTVGVQSLVCFGNRAAHVDEQLVQWLRSRELNRPVETMFQPGDAVVVTTGPFAGIEAIYQTSDAERRAMILLEILHKPVQMAVENTQLRKLD